MYTFKWAPFALSDRSKVQAVIYAFPSLIIKALCEYTLYCCSFLLTMTDVEFELGEFPCPINWKYRYSIIFFGRCHSWALNRHHFPPYYRAPYQYGWRQNWWHHCVIHHLIAHAVWKINLLWLMHVTLSICRRFFCIMLYSSNTDLCSVNSHPSSLVADNLFPSCFSFLQISNIKNEPRISVTEMSCIFSVII